MSYPLPFSENHRDCLQELANVAMGAAGESLAEYTGAFVELPIPEIRYIAPAQLRESLASLPGTARVSAGVQAFSANAGPLYAMVVVADEALAELAILRGLAPDGPDAERSLLSALTGVICDTCLNTLAELTGRPVQTEPAFICAEQVPLAQLVLDDLVSVDYLTSIEITYRLENNPFLCDLLLLFPEATNPALTQLLDEVLGA